MHDSEEDGRKEAELTTTTVVIQPAPRYNDVKACVGRRPIRHNEGKNG